MLQSDADVDDLKRLFDDQFSRLLCISEGFISKLKDKQDRLICARWIQMLCSLKSHDPDVKSNRNAFFQYFIQVTQKASLEASNVLFAEFQHEEPQDMQTAHNPAWLEDQLNDLESIEKLSRNLPYFAHWSKDHRTYVAAKAIPQHGALIYMAVSKHPTSGWENLTGSAPYTEDNTNPGFK